MSIEIATSSGNPPDEKVRSLSIIEASGLFDQAWYTREYPDVAQLAIKPIEHFFRFGGRLLRDPGPSFSTRAYVSANPDAARADGHPLLHYLAKEARARAVRDAPAPLRGYIGRLEECLISGWAVDARNPGKPVQLELRLDGQLLTSFATALPRRDVDAAGHDGANAGFALTFPRGLFDKGAKISVAFTETGQELKRSPVVVTSDRAADRGVGARFMDALAQRLVRPLTIVIPIFDAYDAVRECVDSVSGYVGGDVELLLIDDASPDPRIQELLAAYEGIAGIQVTRNSDNLGYTRTVNRGLSMSGGRDVVLLNSDTVVTGRWIHQLRYCAYAFGKVATVTALSNNAGAFSVPEMGEENPVPSGPRRDAYAQAISNAGHGATIDVPTGNGFCLFMRRDAIDEIGAFDEEKFPRGYGEENDFCMRALRVGWRHLVSDKAFVIHKRSQSFQGEKAALIKRASEMLHEDYPEYRLLIARFRDLEFSMIRLRAREAVQADGQQRVRRRILFVISTQTGGTPQTNLDLMRQVATSHECFLLRSDASMVSLSKLVDGQLQLLEEYRLARRIDPIRHASQEYDNHVADLIYRYSIELMHVRHMAWHGLGLIDAAKSLGVPVVYSIHDFYTVCPTVKLLDQAGTFCGGACTVGPGSCKVELWGQDELPDLKHRYVNKWRDNQARSLGRVDAFVTTSGFVADLFVQAFPAISREKFSIIPHGRDFGPFGCPQPRLEERLRVLVLGNISAAKGAALIREMATNDAAGGIEFHMLGAMSSELTGVGIHHGTYDRENVVQKIAEIAPHVGLLFSIWPETFCHTLTEMWAGGVPVMGMDIGAVGERLNKTQAGWLIKSTATADEALETLLGVASDPAGYQQRVDAVRLWQETEGRASNCHAMAERYLELYEGMLRLPD